MNHRTEFFEYLTGNSNVEFQCKFAIVTSCDSIRSQLNDDCVVLFKTRNAFLECLKVDSEFVAKLTSDPVKASDALKTANESIKDDVKCAKESGVDGIFYELGGAAPKWCTPMQYGGMQLQLDEEIMSIVKDCKCNILKVLGGKEAYLDFILQLSTNILSWVTESSSDFRQRLFDIYQGIVLVSEDPFTIQRFGKGRIEVGAHG